MMKPFCSLLVFAAVLALTALACNLPLQEQEPEPYYILIQSITISPESGPAPFEGHVSVETTPNLGDDTLSCYISADSGNVEVFRQLQPGSSARESLTFSFSFSYSVPGSHDLVCKSEQGQSSWSDTFTVTMPEEPAVEVPAGTFQLPRWGDFKNAQLTVYISDSPYAWVSCWDPVGTTTPLALTVSPTGVLSASCQSMQEKANSSETVSGMLNGQWDESSGTITFEFDATRTTTYKDDSSIFTNTYVIKGTGQFNTNNTASGSGQWTQGGSCTSPGCSVGQANGVAKWAITFSP